MKSQVKTKKISYLGKKIIITVIITLLILGIVLLFMGHHYLKSSLKPLDSSNTRLIQVKIPVGASDRKIGSVLQSRKVVRNGLMFSYYVKSRNISNLKAGYYQLSPSMSLKQVSKSLRIGGANHPISLKKRQIIVTPNERTTSIVTQLGRSGLQFKHLLVNRNYRHRLARLYPNLGIKRNRTILGAYLAPGRYVYNPNDLRSLLNQMVSKTSYQVKNNQERIHRAHLTVPEAYRMAAYFSQSHLNVSEQRSLARLWLYNSVALRHVHFYVIKHNGKIVRRIAINFNDRNIYRSPSMASILLMLPDRKINSGRLYFTVNDTDHQIYGSIGSFNDLRLIDQAIDDYK